MYWIDSTCFISRISPAKSKVLVTSTFFRVSSRVLFLVSKFCSHSAKCSLDSNSSGMYILNSKLPVKEELQHRHTCGQPCWPDCIQQATDQGGSTTQGHMRLLFLARLHLAGYQSVRSCNIGTHVVKPASQTALESVFICSTSSPV